MQRNPISGGPAGIGDDVSAGIGWHRDKRHFDQVFGVSLASACKFRFRRRADNKWERFTLNARSQHFRFGPTSRRRSGHLSNVAISGISEATARQDQARKKVQPDYRR
jgi:hypothetical protein